MNQARNPDAIEDSRRRSFLRQGGLALAWLAGVTALLSTTRASADDDMLSKTQVHYQMKPHDKQHCSLCAYFIPGGSASATGTCRLVSGTIYPDGWCRDSPSSSFRRDDAPSALRQPHTNRSFDPP